MKLRVSWIYFRSWQCGNFEPKLGNFEGVFPENFQHESFSATFIEYVEIKNRSKRSQDEKENGVWIGLPVQHWLSFSEKFHATFLNFPSLFSLFFFYFYFPAAHPLFLTLILSFLFHLYKTKPQNPHLKRSYETRVFVTFLEPLCGLFSRYFLVIGIKTMWPCIRGLGG